MPILSKHEVLLVLLDTSQSGMLQAYQDALFFNEDQPQWLFFSRDSVLGNKLKLEMITSLGM